MSVLQQAYVWGLDLPGEEQHVLLALADHAHDDGTKCYPGKPYLAWKCNKSERAIQRILARMEEKGLIEVVGSDQGGRGHTTEYIIHTEKGDKKTPFRTGKRETPATVKGDAGDTKGDAGDALYIIGTIREPDYEPEAAPQAPRARHEPLDAAFFEALREEYAPLMGGRQRVQDAIDAALNHKASRNWVDKRQGLRTWLRRDAEHYQDAQSQQARRQPYAGSTGRPGYRPPPAQQAAIDAATAERRAMLASLG